jgi:putative methyltransferase
VHLFQPQYATTIDNINHYWLPYSSGCVWAYVQQFDDIQQNWELKTLQYQRSDIDEVIESLDDPTICGFSCYVWNERYNLALAQRIKERWPQCWLVFGGPQTGGNHVKYEFINSIIFSEGEESFLEILRTLQQGGTPEQFYRKKRLENLDIPSPYLIGLFDNIIAEAEPGCFFQTVLETNRGCPYACTFCDWGGLTYSKIKKFELEKIEEEILWFRDNPVSVVFFADANFGIFKDRDLEIARMIGRHLENSSVEYVAMNYTKNSNETVFSIAKEFGKVSRSVTLSVQSMNPATLKAIRRDNMKSNDLSRLLQLSKQYNIATYSDMILGLPEETLESWRQGLADLLELGQHNHVDIYIANILENTELNLEQRTLYGIKSVQSENYQPFSIHDPSGIKEYTELITETSTMPRADMIEAYMYHWMMQNFHFAGYSQLFSKYCRNVLNVGYRDFYDRLMQSILKDQGVIGQEYQHIKSMVTRLLATGDLGENVEIHFFYTKSYYYFYQHLDQVVDFSARVAGSFGDLDRSVLDLQRRFVLNDIWQPDCDIVCNYDIDTWEATPTRYYVRANMATFSPSFKSFQLARRSGAIKNSLLSSQNKTDELMSTPDKYASIIN